MNCIFCRIILGELPGTFVYRGPRVVAFMDIQPVNFGHVLVVPIEHHVLVGDMPESLAGELFVVARRMGLALRKSGLRCEGVKMLLADGEAAGQEVPHVHLHVFPQFKGDGFGLRYAERYFQKPPRAELEEHAARILAALGDGPPAGTGVTGG